MKFEDLSWAEILAAGTVAGFVIKGMTYLAKRIFTFAVLVNTMDDIKTSFNELKNESNMRLNKQDKVLEDHSGILKSHGKKMDELLELAKRVVRNGS